MKLFVLSFLVLFGMVTCHPYANVYAQRFEGSPDQWNSELEFKQRETICANKSVEFTYWWNEYKFEYATVEDAMNTVGNELLNTEAPLFAIEAWTKELRVFLENKNGTGYEEQMSTLQNKCMERGY